MHRLKNTEIVRTIRLLRLIEDSQDDLTISDIADALEVSQVTVSRLLKKLHYIDVVDKPWNKRGIKRGNRASQYLRKWGVTA